MAKVATAFGVTAKTVRKWRSRHAAESEAGLRDRSSRPHASPTRLDQAAQAEILALRRHGLGRLAALDARPEIVRYQRGQPDELIHIDIKKLGRVDGIGHRITGDRRSRKRGRGWDFLHVAIDDASRLAYTEILPDERKASPVALLERALAWFSGLGVQVERVMTDNGFAYVSHAFRQAIQNAGLKYKRTRPYTPRTNGKADPSPGLRDLRPRSEQSIETSLREWAYRQAFASSAERTAAMRPWLHASTAGGHIQRSLESYLFSTCPRTTSIATTARTRGNTHARYPHVRRSRRRRHWP